MSRFVVHTGDPRPERVPRLRRLALAAGVVALAAVPAATAASAHDAGVTTITLARTISGKADLDGRWTMKLTAEGTRYRISLDGAFVAKGKLRESRGNRLRFTDTGGPGACQGTGSYTYTDSEANRSFAFKAVSDPCAARKVVLVGTWKVVSAS